MLGKGLRQIAERQGRRKDLAEQIADREQKQGFDLRHYQRPRPGLVAELLQLRQFLEPVLLIENPSPGTLVETLARSADGAALALYDEAAIGRMIEAAEGKAAEDLQALETGWAGRTLRARNQIIIEPAVPCVIQCSARRQRALLDLGAFSDHLLVLPAAAQGDGMVDPGILARFSEQILTLADRRESGRQDEVSFTPGAEARLAQFKREKLPQMGSASEEQRRLVSMAPVLAGKFALDLHLFSPELFAIAEDEVEAAQFLVERLGALAAPDQGTAPRPTVPAAGHGQ